jgi:hypothetical protein
MSASHPAAVRRFRLRRAGAGLLLVIALLAGSSLPSGGQAPAVPELPLPHAALAQIGGLTTDLAVHGDIAFVGTGPSVLAYDVGSSLSPRLVGQIRPLPDVPEALAVDPSGYLYVASRHTAGREPAHLLVFDVRAPGSPRLVGHTRLRAREVGALVVEPPRAYALTDGGLTIVDIKSVSQPVEVAMLPLDGRPDARGALALSDGLVVVAGPAGLAVVDPTEAGRPRLLATLPLPAVDVAVERGLALAVHPSLGLRVVDLADASRPRVVATAAVAGGPLAITAEGGTAVVATDEGRRLVRLDLREPERPRPLEEVTMTDVASLRVELRLSGGRLLLAGGRVGLHTADVSALGRLRRPAEPVVPPLAAVAVAGEDVFAAAGPAGLFVLRRSTAGYRVHGRLEEVAPAGRPLALTAWGAAVAGDRLYLAAEGVGVAVLDVSQPAQPRLVATLAVPIVGGPQDLALVGRGLLVSAADGSLRRLEPGHEGLRETARRDDVRAVGFAADGRLVYAVAPSLAYGSVLHVLDAAAGLRTLAQLELDKSFSRVWVSGGRAVLSGAFGDVAVLDVGDPARPRELHRLRHLVAGRVAMRGDEIYAADPAALHTLETVDGEPPRQVQWTPLPSGRPDWLGTSDVSADGRDLVVLRGEAGLFAVPFAEGAAGHGHTVLLPALGDEPARREPTPPDCARQPRQFILVLDEALLAAERADATRRLVGSVLSRPPARGLPLVTVLYGSQAAAIRGAGPLADAPPLGDAARAGPARLDLGLAAALIQLRDGEPGPAAVLALSAGAPDDRTRRLLAGQLAAWPGDVALAVLAVDQDEIPPQLGPLAAFARAVARGRPVDEAAAWLSGALAGCH